jgi:DUF971 family protein
MAEITPKDFTANRQTKTLAIEWSDGSKCELPFAILRNTCPCAECQGGHENMKQEPDPDVFDLPIIDVRATALRRIELVGNYAITLEWEDGHHFGIYNWTYLMALCQEATRLASS